MKEREARRRFWTALIARFEGSGKSRREFAAEADVGLAIFQYWLYKLRRERGTKLGRTARAPEVRLVPVTVKARPVPPALIEIRVGGVRLRVPFGTDVDYVGRLAAVLRDGRSC